MIRKWKKRGGGTYDYVIIDFNTTDQETIDAVRTAYKVIDKTMYDADGNVIGTWDTSKLEVGSIRTDEIQDALYSDWDGTINKSRGLTITEFNSDLSSLVYGYRFFYTCENFTTFTSDLSSLVDGSYMFRMTALSSFSGNLRSLVDGTAMFYGAKFTSFDNDLSSLVNGREMFRGSDITSFNCKLGNLTNGYYMFNGAKFTSFSEDLSSLVDGTAMFYTTTLTSFSSNLSSLLSGYNMFLTCNLTTESIKCIADSIRDLATEGLVTSSDGGKTWTVVANEIWDVISTASYRAKLHLYSADRKVTNEIKTLCNKIAAKGWTVYLNGSSVYEPTNIAITDEIGETPEAPISYWYKPIPVEEEIAEYTNANGEFFNIVGGQFVFGDDLSTYGMFTCEEDAAINMGLTKIEKP